MTKVSQDLTWVDIFMKMNITGEVSNSGHWMECSIYQNYSASEVLVQGLAGVVNQVNVIKGLYTGI